MDRPSFPAPIWGESGYGHGSRPNPINRRHSPHSADPIRQRPSPAVALEARAGIEPTYEDLQSSAWPLCHRAGEESRVRAGPSKVAGDYLPPPRRVKRTGSGTRSKRIWRGEYREENIDPKSRPLLISRPTVPRRIDSRGLKWEHGADDPIGAKTVTAPATVSGCRTSRGPRAPATGAPPRGNREG